jgi:ribose transport system substrate-binding protein
MRSKFRRNLFLFSILSIACVFYVNSFQKNLNNDSELYHISAIVREKNSEHWAITKQGMEHAADEMHVELTFIILQKDNQGNEQASLIEREVSNGAQAIVISDIDHSGLANAAYKIPAQIPAICIESTAPNSSVTSYVSADNYEMGAALGEAIASSGHKMVLLINSDIMCDPVQSRKKGILSVFEKNGVSFKKRTLPDISRDYNNLLPDIIKKENVDAIVTLDSEELEICAQALDRSNIQNTGLFGMGTNSNIVHFIEQGVISGAVVQNDFAIGYLAIKSAVDALKKDEVPKQTLVEYKLIDQTNMYHEDNEGLLFPFIR